MYDVWMYTLLRQLLLYVPHSQETLHYSNFSIYYAVFWTTSVLSYLKRND